MKFNLARLNSNTKTVTNTDEAFIGTPLAEEAFSITVKMLEPEDKIDIYPEAVRDDGTISQGKYTKALFILSIHAVDGIVDENGEEITMEDNAPLILWKLAPDELKNEINLKIKEFTSLEEKKSDIPEQDLTVSQIGQ